MIEKDEIEFVYQYFKKKYLTICKLCIDKINKSK